MAAAVAPSIGVMQTRGGSRGRASRGSSSVTIPQAPAPQLSVPPRPVEKVAAKPPASTEQVSISLIDLLEQLKSEVTADKLPRLQQLQLQATEHPEEQVKLKRDILMLAGADALRAAVGALMERSRAPPPPPAEEPPLPSLWPTDMSKDDFKAALVHSFHCRTPSCPVAGCASVTAKLQRLHQHVQACDAAASGCRLCAMWTNLKFYRDGFEGGPEAGMPPSGAQYAEPLLHSSQLLPRWHNGKVVWMMPHEALSQVLGPGVLAGLEAAPAPACRVPDEEGASGAAPRVGDGPAVKRRKKNGASMPPPRAPHAAFPGMQGVLETPATLAYLNSLDGSCGGACSAAGMHDMLRMQDIEYEAQMGGACGACACSGSGASAGAGLGGLPMNRCGSSTLSLSNLPLGHSLSGSLAELFRTPSFGGTLTPSNSFGPGMPLGKTKGKSTSEVSLGTFLENTGGDLNDILNEFGPSSSA